MNKLGLKSGDVILVDFDGIIVEANKPDGTSYYPEIGPIKKYAKEFLTLMHKGGFKVEIWSARTNHTTETEKYPMYGHKAMMQIHQFMRDNDLPYDSILMTHKPIGKHYAKVLFDDQVSNWDPEQCFKELAEKIKDGTLK